MDAHKMDAVWPLTFAIGEVEGKEADCTPPHRGSHQGSSLSPSSDHFSALSMHFKLHSRQWNEWGDAALQTGRTECYGNGPCPSLSCTDAAGVTLTGVTDSPEMRPHPCSLTVEEAQP